MSNSKKTKMQLEAEVKKLQRKILLLEKNKKTVSQKISNTLLEKDSKWESFFKHSENVIIVVDKKGTIIDINKVAKGFKKENVIGTPASGFFAKEEQLRVRKIINSVFKTGITKKYETKALDNNNEWAYYSCKATPIKEKNKTIAVVIYIVNSTQKVNTENALRLSEEKFKNLSDSAFEGIAIHQNGKVVEVNKATCKTFEYSEKEIVGRPIFDFVHPDFRAIVAEKVKKEDPNPYQIKMLKKGKKEFWAEISGNKFFYKGQLARVTAIRDISAYKSAEEKLKESENNFSVLINNFPGIAYRCKLDKNLTMLFLSNGFFKLTGYSPQDLINNKKIPFNDIIHPEDRGNDKIEEAIKAKKIFEVEYRIINSKNEIKWVWEKGQGVFDENGKLLYLEGFIADINDKKKYELELKQSRENYKNLVEESPDGVLIHIDGKIVYANESVAKIFEAQKVKSVVGYNLFDFVLPHFHKLCKERIQQVKLGKNPNKTTMEVKTLKGNIVEVETNPNLINYNNQEAIQVIIHDLSTEKKLIKEQLRAQVAEETNELLEQEITKRKVAQIKLTESENYIKNIIESSLDMICASDKNGYVTEFNLAAQKTFGYTQQEIIGKHSGILYADSANKSKGINKQLLENGVYSGEIINVKKNGQTFLTYLTAAVLKNEQGEIIGSMGISRDISELKKAEQILRNSEEKYRDLFENATDLIQSVGADGKIVYVNTAWKKVLGYSDEEINNHLIFDFIHPDSLEHCLGLFSRILKGEKTESIEITFKAKDGRAVTCEGNVNSKVEQGKIISTRGIFRDVTISHQITKEIKQSEERYKAIYNQAYIGIAQVNLDGKYLQVNDRLCDIMGYSKEELLQKTTEEITHSEDHEKLPGREFIIEKNIEKLTTIKRYIRKDKKIVIANITISLIKDLEGKPLYFVSVYEDITEQRKAEEKLHSQSAKLKTVFESSSHIIWTLDRNIKVTSYNTNFEKFHKRHYNTDVHIGLQMNAGKMVSTEDYNSFWQKKYDASLAGEAQHFETKLVDKNDEVVWREIFLNPIVDSTGKVIEISGIAHDITEKKLAEEKINQSLKEKEILLKEVHHRVKNNLQVISSILNLQSSYVKDEATLGILRESQNRIKSMAFIHESLYQTKDFSSINFSEYVINLCQNLIHSYSSFNHNVKLNLDIQNVFLNLDLAIPCGLIINEIISNALKYAFVTKSEKDIISVKMQEEGQKLFLKIGDNGVGLSEKIDFKNTESLGLQLVITLIEQLNGIIDIDTKNGTMYLISFNKNQAKTRI